MSGVPPPKKKPYRAETPPKLTPQVGPVAPRLLLPRGTRCHCCCPQGGTGMSPVPKTPAMGVFRGGGAWDKSGAPWGEPPPPGRGIPPASPRHRPPVPKSPLARAALPQTGMGQGCSPLGEEGGQYFRLPPPLRTPPQRWGGRAGSSNGEPTGGGRRPCATQPPPEKVPTPISPSLRPHSRGGALT